MPCSNDATPFRIQVRNTDQPGMRERFINAGMVLPKVPYTDDTHPQAIHIQSLVPWISVKMPILKRNEGNWEGLLSQGKVPDPSKKIIHSYPFKPTTAI